MSTLAARRAEYQASQNQNPKMSGGGGATVAGAGVDDGSSSTSPVRWSSADERALEEAVMRARTGLLFVGVKT